MRSIVALVIDHQNPIHNLADLVADRAKTLPGVDDARHADEIISLPVVDVMEQHDRAFKAVKA